MSAGFSRYLRVIYLLGDFLFLNLTFLVVSIYYQWPRFSADTSFLAQFIYINLIWLITTLITGVHNTDRGKRFEELVIEFLRAFLLFTVFIIAFLYFLDNILIPVFHIEAKLGAFSLIFLLWRCSMAALFSFIRRRGLNFRRVVIVGEDTPALEMKKFFDNHPEAGYKLIGTFASDSQLIDGIEHFHLSEIKHFSITNKVDEIYCSLAGTEPDMVTELMDFADHHLIRFRILPDFRGFLNKKVRIDFFESVPVLSVRNEPLQNIGNQTLKRVFDILFSLVILLTVFPIIFIILAPLIKLSSKGPVFFKQLRSGRDNQTFYCYKFRTMKLNEHADLQQAQAGDARITPIGSFLRKSSMDELPQFFNVLIGNMSVVGPRPHMLKHTEEYAKYINKFMVRHFVKPGLTGWAQVHGYRGETKETELMQKRVEYDVWYIENWNIVLDVKIIVLTVIQILTGDQKGV